MVSGEAGENGARDSQATSNNGGALEVTRRAVIRGAAAGTVLATTTSPAAAAPLTNDPDALTRYVTRHRGWFATKFPGSDVITHETGDPQWVVDYDVDSAVYSEWLSDWIGSSESRVEVTHNSTRGYLVLAAPVGDVVPEKLGFGGSDVLAERSGINSVEPVRKLTNTDPIEPGELLSESEWSPPGSALEQLVYGKVPAAGNRFDDAGPYTLSDVTNRAGFGDVTETGGGFTVAVVDTGLNFDSSLYGDRVNAGKNTITGETIDPANGDYTAVEDGNLHGSWVTTAAAGNGSSDTGTGAAPSASLIPIKALADDGSGSTTDIVHGIEFAAKNGADIINLSLGAPVRAQPIVDAIMWAVTDQDVTAVVTAAGNSRMTTHYMGSPAEAAETIPVASIDAEPASESLSAYYSSVAPHPRSDESMGVAAGGHRVKAAVSEGTGVTDKQLSGTSMASPVVAGLAAVVLEADSSLQGKPVEMRERLEAAAEPLPKCGVTEVGAGRIDAPRAVAGNASDGDQKSARDSNAESRDAMNRNIISPGWLA